MARRSKGCPPGYHKAKRGRDRCVKSRRRRRRR